MNYRLFISHAWTYSNDYYNMKKLLDEYPYFNWTNYSVPRHDGFPDGTNLKEALKKQIRPVNAVIIIAGMYAVYREWIEFEVNFAKSIRKPIIIVRPWGQERIPQYLQNNATAIVGWNASSIVNAVREYSI